MAIEFYETELAKVQEEFNSTYGKQIVCDIQTRSVVILSIIAMGLLIKRIHRATDKNDVSADINNFGKYRQGIKNIFETIQKNSNERRNYVYVNKKIKTNRRGDDRANRRLSQMQKPIHCHLA